MLEQIVNALIWLGHDGFRLSAAGKTIYFDPFQIPGGQPPADIVFISHGHRDHFSPDDLKKIRHTGTVCVAESETAARLAGGRTVVVAPGDRLEVEGFPVEVVPAYNIGKKFHPRANRWPGFVVTVEGVRIYHAGDTDFIPEMEGLKCDIALLPVSGTYVMTPDEAAQAALAIRPAVAIPMHFDSVVGSRADAERFAALLAGTIRVVLPELAR